MTYAVGVGKHPIGIVEDVITKMVFSVGYDGTTITSEIMDQMLVQRWFLGEVDYLCTIDRCCFPKYDRIEMSETPRRSLTIPNAGGFSNISEALSMCYMEHLYNATDFVPEKEIDYWIEYKMCDYLMTIKRVNYGVSVTRAMTHPFDTEFTYQHAVILLNKKLYGLIVARNSVNKRHRFNRSILHIWCHTRQASENLQKAYYDLIACNHHSAYSQVMVICTISPNMCIFTNLSHKN
jgi:hypothetical protein